MIGKMIKKILAYFNILIPLSEKEYNLMNPKKRKIYERGIITYRELTKDYRLNPWKYK